MKIDFEDNNLKKVFIKTTIPLIIAMTINALYNTVDTIFVGRALGPDGLGALAVAFPLQMVIIALAVAIGTGTSVLVSMNLGKKEGHKNKEVIGNSFSLAAVSGIILGILFLIFLKPLIMLVGGTENLLPYTQGYLRIISMEVPLVFLSMVGFNIIRSEGNSKMSMYLMAIGAITNMILDPIFIFGFGWGVEGAAIATVLSRVLSTVFILKYLIKNDLFAFESKYLKIKRELSLIVIKLGSGALIGQITPSIIAVIVNLLLLKYGGEIYLSVYSIINRLLMLVILPLIAIGQGFQPIASYHYGANNNKKIFQYAKIAIIYTVIICLVFLILISLFPEQIIGIFTVDQRLINLTKKPLFIVNFFLPLVGIQLISYTLFQSIGKPLPSLLISLSRQVSFLIPLMIILPIFYGVNGLWYAYPISDIVSIILSIFSLRILKKRMI